MLKIKKKEAFVPDLPYYKYLSTLYIALLSMFKKYLRWESIWPSQINLASEVTVNQYSQKSLVKPERHYLLLPNI